MNRINKHIQIIIAFCFFILFNSCRVHQELITSSGDEHKINIKYGDDKRNIMDVYLPKNRDEQTPFVIMLHGGAWIIGGKNMLQTMQQKLLEKGVASANLNFRLVSEDVNYLVMLQDIHNAILFCQLHAKEWNITLGKYHIIGESSGAHLALLYGNKHPENIKSIMALSAHVNFGSEVVLDHLGKGFESLLIQTLAGVKYEPEKGYIPEPYKDMSPYHRINHVPTYLLHGGKDFLADPQRVFEYVSLLSEKGVAYKFTFKPKWGHSYRLFSKKNRQFVYAEILTWLENNNDS